jgi:hypothetical protein
MLPGLPDEDDAEPSDDDAKDSLWNRLDGMRPPAAGQPRQNPPTATHHDVPKKEAQPIPGWNGEFSEDFPDPMDEGDEHYDDEPSPLVPPPFEQLDRYGFFHGLYLTIKLVLLSPRLFFSVMPVGGGLAKPLTFTILLTMIQGLFQYFWELAGLSTSIGPGGADTVGGGSGTVGALMMLLLMPAFIAAGQFAVTGVYHLLLILMHADNKGFEGTFRALAYANAPLVLGIFPMPVSGIEIGWMFIAALWGLFLTIIGLRYIHNTTYAKVVPVAFIPLLLAMIGGLLVYYGQMATI